MKILNSLIFLFLLIVAGGQATDILAQISEAKPEKVDLCTLISNRKAYDHKLIEVTGFVSRGFEDSILFNGECGSDLDIWVEVGGKAGTGTMYCCNVPASRTRPDELTVQQIKIPLVDDEHFKEFDALLQKRPDSVAKATMIGRFFAAEKTTFQNGNERWMGFGHRGMFSLFVIQQVLSVEPHYQSGLDYGHYVDQPNLENEGCGNYRIMFHNSPQVIRDAQQKAESGERLWSFDDPERVAREGLAQAIGGGTTKPITLSETRRQDGRIVYHWRPNGKKGTRYMVIVNRSYWLSFYSKNPVKVAWVMAAAYSICE